MSSFIHRKKKNNGGVESLSCKEASAALVFCVEDKQWNKQEWSHPCMELTFGHAPDPYNMVIGAMG